LTSDQPSPPPAELLLGRPEFSGDLHEAAEIVRGKRVLVTGAAGSIGSPFAHRLLSAGPQRLVLLDHHEHSLFSLERALGRGHAELHFELADVRDVLRLGRIFEEHRPDVVVHLAAAKHVPYGERFPEGAVAVNVLATRTLLQLADRSNTTVFIYPSSDKSVEPPSLYGATKRVAEALVQSSAQQRHWGVVRYVNIIGTRGSVIETFTQQILAGQPLTVTDERMTRYWISMDEAIWCALMSGQRAAPGEIVMPACGEPQPLMETASRLAGWYRPERVPYPIICTGVRPGERLHEVLLSPRESFVEGLSNTPGLRPVQSTRDPAALANLTDVMDELERSAAAGDRQALARTLLAAADALQ
jgi:FlaA1/EpsC-like NDP-sugar epimerase